MLTSLPVNNRMLQQTNVIPHLQVNILLSFVAIHSILVDTNRVLSPWVEYQIQGFLDVDTNEDNPANYELFHRNCIDVLLNHSAMYELVINKYSTGYSSIVTSDFIVSVFKS
jgi:hypothetical protein